ncbi:MAG TPA: hypothetical protein VG797_05380 [Phycisphaerales bacterium]|nr:hypothetical protein [Phycisphaerales bacterium]
MTPAIAPPTDPTTSGAGAAPVKPILARFELDHFCETCAYNMRGHEVWKDERLGILVCRCSECGTYQPANQALPSKRLWVRWWTPAVLVLWMLVALGLHAGAMGATGGSYVGTAEMIHDLGRGRVDPQEYRIVLGIFIAMNAVLGFGMACFAAVLFGHWWMVGRVLLAIAWPAVPLSIFLFAAAYSGATEPAEAAQTVCFLAAIEMGTGIFGAIIGRPTARLLVRVFLPAGMRQGMAFLWTNDGLTPPKMEAKRV